jgi:hypothetical protein
VNGSATAETSFSVRPPQPGSLCQAGLVFELQPLPVPVQAVSAQPRALEAGVSVVPPTATTDE